MAPLFEDSGFAVHEYGAQVLTRPGRFRYPLKMGALVPYVLAEKLAPLFPSHMFVLKPARARRS
jgi:hypothetical protein